MGQIITLASGKGGVGKTVVTATFGAALAERGKRVLLLDGDMGLRDLDLVLGVEDRVLFDIFDVATGRCFEEDAILHIAPNLDFMPASQQYRWEELEGDAVLTVLEDLRDRYDYLLIDSPAGIGKGLMYTLAMADRIFLVVEPTWVSLRDADRVMHYMHEDRMFHYALIFNNFHNAQTPGYLTAEEMANQMQPEHLGGILPHAPEVIARSQAGNVTNMAQLGAFGKAMTQMVDDFLAGRERGIEEWSQFIDRHYRSSEGKRSRIARRQSQSAAWRRRRG